MYKQFRYTNAGGDFYHLRTHDGLEVDLLLETPAGYYAFEIKEAEHTRRADASALFKLDGILDKPLLHGFLLSNDMQTHEFGGRITAVHAGYFLG
jgi:hypothetical protein